MNYLAIGSGSDIGNQIISMLLDEGHSVYGISRSETERDHPKYHHLIHDVTSEEELPGGYLPESLDGLVYLPGSIHLKPFRAIKEEQYLADFRINLLGAIKVIRWAFGNMKKGSSIVLFSTVAVQTGMAYHASIASSKGAVEGLTRSLAAEFAPKIRVNCIAPSLTNTKLAERLLSTPERRESSAERHPLKSIGDPGDIAEMAVFLLGKKSKWVTGQVMHVDGGISNLRK
jgi:NAD(P)-dependent dehydrogenase (short-subunit alcohol dehydrogenase family)